MKATFAAGCFWHVEDLLSKTKGVKSTQVGYIGGQLLNPTYEEVCTDKTGHAEAVEVEYNPDEISYETLLDVFWNNHNPTTLNRQGHDVGIQYRSVIFYHNDEQKEIAEKSKQKLDKSGQYDRPVVTEIVSTPIFYKAEEYHQKYFEKHGFS
ncbi:peptide-methionine (S)-S-oxide reductase MsrA [Marine Group I thaumarchaeote]|uniref:Peptide methionine sulfoxide reductase MsrA n=1 Tax=Marine Group I thaumarchaeote TaxID=2511932 RepID=A0A7K4NIV6_9ARCH|nr:MAG: peptide-methionine (S)-S-oxide reductase [Nitrosopumilus sp. YT1]NMI82667.1 peptide-methionine (S)-S-oxide reductase [Candidatus Nitrosopumilus sp. MTA1]NWJ20852.1 peptide-methionine (S)-S-oxide reductase MsrA [Marine Group I thaumarchaeote]NWJ28717.1 peptide-methionine (S)-S-oxide reductase MsrA [Marine Group I thaumarchaeote]NWJ83662.1 peptide-methionine (S)-S-oxide reductase MsrA [Marine Group I thaumarchaeote]